MARQSKARAASATLRVPTTFVNAPSHGLASTSGTCFSAAAWKIIAGRTSPVSRNTRSRSRTSPISARSGKSGKRSRISISMEYRLNSPLSSSASCDGPSAAICRVSSAPMVPPAPVTSTDKPFTSSAMAPRSRAACGRPSRSSMAMGRSSILPSSRADLNSVKLGRRAKVSPSASARSNRPRNASPFISACGRARISLCGRRPRRSKSATMRSRSSGPPNTGTPRMACPVRRPLSSTKPTMRYSDDGPRPNERINTSAASFAPSTSTGIAVAPPPTS